MARTWAHRPEWVQRFDPDNAGKVQILHDHRDHTCIVETVDDMKSSRRNKYKHNKECQKLSNIIAHCPNSTKNPSLPENYCFRTKRNIETNLDNPQYIDTLYNKYCNGHIERTYNANTPCLCDNDPETPTCSIWWTADDYNFFASLIPDTSHEWKARKRRTIRSERANSKTRLNTLTKEFNSNGDIEEWETPHKDPTYIPHAW